MWCQLDAADADLDFDQLEEKFAAKVAQPLGNAKASAAARGRGAPKHLTLLPLQRAQNIGVFLAKLKMGPLQARGPACPSVSEKASAGR